MRKLLLIAAATAVLSASCATVQQNIDARALLAQCTYQYDGVKFVAVTLDGLVPTNVDLEVKVKVTNPTKKDVALDHLKLRFSLEKNEVLRLDHNQFVRIASGNSASEPIAVGLPLKGIVAEIGKRPPAVQVHADLWVTLLIGKDTWETPLVLPIDFEVPLPWAEIDQAIEKKKNELAKIAADKAKEAADQAAKAAQSAAQNALGGVKFP